MSTGDREALVLNCNKVAMDYLRLDNYKESLVLLKKAEALLNVTDSGDEHNRLKLLGITLNNLGCYYKRRKQPNVALYYLKQALDIEIQQGKDNVNLAGTHLNICAIYSQVGKHSEALQHAYDAFRLVEEVKDLGTEDQAGKANTVTTLIIAYHNVAVELEFLNQVKEAVEFYRKGLEVATQQLGSEHGLTKSISDSNSAAVSRFRQLHDFTEVRKSRRDQARVPAHDAGNLILPTRGHRAKSNAKVSDSPKRPIRLPSLNRDNYSFRIEQGPSISPEFPSFHSYRGVVTAGNNSPKFKEKHRVMMEDGIAGTRKFVSPNEKLKMYLNPHQL